MKSGDIWLVDLTDGKGHEQRGIRSAIIFGSANGIVMVVPLTSNVNTARLSHTHAISPDEHNGLDTESIALVFQMVSLDRERFHHRIGTIGEDHRLAIAALIRDLMGLD
ncbi:type II toxin-antitoxin system PemK/MazF family toxin [Methanoregula sp.]|uniref:type II toxin-antitoxin system PemK/MazF family toxin n=1 Tax=Methanoregula sp. TaxID=2052170 RepID=UPI0026239A0F|nr:type II toxin-antitoxin system PemK/MazF family toxin [Methanoregula sp.]MDD5142666.1 type II toxin-antitoxin system PemK/MazF family toxin [Methanoregula sp.]